MKKLEGLLFTIILTVAFAVFPALMQVNAGTLDHPGPWLSALAVAVVVAIGTGGYTWLRQQGYTVTVSKPLPPAPGWAIYSTDPSAPSIQSAANSQPVRQVAASPVVLPDGWVAAPTDTAAATSASPPV